MESYGGSQRKVTRSDDKEKIKQAVNDFFKDNSPGDFSSQANMISAILVFADHRYNLEFAKDDVEQAVEGVWGELSSAAGDQHNGLSYESVGDYQGRQIYARLDHGAILALQAGKDLTPANLFAYETAMRKSVIPSGSTGSDGIKYDNGTWVIKLTIPIARAQGIDNSLSPMANEDRDDETNRIYLNFNQLVMRH